jgi:hypothetical protein
MKEVAAPGGGNGDQVLGGTTAAYQRRDADVVWSKLDDKLHMHQKARAAFKTNPAAMGLWVMCLSYCGDQLTDGFVPAWYVNTLLPGRKGIVLAQQLCAAGLWEMAQLSDEKGWVFHDYLAFNKSREWVLADRKKTANRQAEWVKQQKALAASNTVANAASNTVSNTVSNAPPDPTRPDPTRSGGPVLHQGVLGNATTERAREAEFEPESADFEPESEPEPPPHANSHDDEFAPGECEYLNRKADQLMSEMYDR